MGIEIFQSLGLALILAHVLDTSSDTVLLKFAYTACAALSGIASLSSGRVGVFS